VRRCSTSCNSQSGRLRTIDVECDLNRLLVLACIALVFTLVTPAPAYTFAANTGGKLGP
jgi:hypothetical protein